MFRPKSTTTMRFAAVLAAGLLAGVAAVPGSASAAPAQTASPQPVWRTDVTGSRIEKKSLIGLVPGGMARSVRLTGLVKTQFFDFGVRSDDVVSRAAVDLAFTTSASVLPTVSQLNFYLNGELQQSFTLEKEMIGSPAKLSVALNPKSIRTQNQITIEFIGHVKSVCENPADDSLWLEVGAQSRLVLEKSRIRLGNDIAKLPAPFVDAASGDATHLPFVFPAAPESRMKEAAAVLAGWAGRIAGWRGADFPVQFNALPAPGHFIVFATNDKRPEFLKDFPQVKGPQVTVADSPNSLWGKMLVVAGRDEADLLVAAKTLVREGNVMIGDTFRPGPFKETPPREAYDAPAWLPVGRTVAFSKIIEYPGQLSSRGYRMPPVQIPVRLAPDLYMTGDANLTLSVKYRTTKPMTGEAAQFRAFLNGALIDSDPTAAKTGQGERVIGLPGFYGALVDNAEGTLALRPQNVLSFTVDYERIADGGTPENCKSVMLLPHQMEIEPVSTIRLEGLYHQAQMPNLKLFTTAGWPFTKYADLSGTAVVIAEGASASEVSTMLNAVGRFAAQTGAVGEHVRVVSSTADRAAAERDLLVIGRVSTKMSDINAQNALELRTSVERAVASRRALEESLQAPAAGVMAEPVAAIVGFESPLKSGRSVVALLSEGPASSLELNARLASQQALMNLSGTTAVIAGDAAASFTVGERYTVGDLPWYHTVWMKLSSHPGWLALCAILSALAIGLSVFLFMRRWVGRRE